MGTDKRQVIFKVKDLGGFDENSLANKWFQIGPDVEMREIPITGEQYVLKVMKERQNCADLTVCYKDIAQFAKNQSLFIEEPPGKKSAPDKLLMTIEWQKIQVSDFSKVNSYLAKFLMKIKNGLMNIETVSIDDDTLEGWRVFFEDNDPTLSCALGLTPDLMERGLEMLIAILKKIQPGHSVDYKTGQWIYTFLARVWYPVHSDTACILRNLARTCADIRSNLNQDDEDAKLKALPLNLFICIVARFFGQIDLAD